MFWQWAQRFLANSFFPPLIWDVKILLYCEISFSWFLDFPVFSMELSVNSYINTSLLY